LLTVTPVTAPAETVISTVRLLPLPPVVATPVAFEYPLPPTIVSTRRTSPVVSSIFTVEDSIGRESLRIQFAPNLTALEPSRPKEDLTSLN